MKTIGLVSVFLLSSMSSTASFSTPNRMTPSRSSLRTTLLFDPASPQRPLPSVQDIFRTHKRISSLKATSEESSVNALKQNLPNWLTYIRCFAIPLLALVYYQPKQNILTASIFAVASITDWFDGYLARRWKVTSDFGAFLDPVADKLMVSTALVLLAGTWGALVALPTAVILAREIAVSALREWMAQRGKRSVVKVGFQGKAKTALTMVSLTLLLLVPSEAVGSLLWKSSIGLLYASALITVTSGAVYFQAAAPLLFSKE